MSVVNLMLLGVGVAALAAPLWVHLRLGKVRKRARVSSLHLMLAARQTSRTPRRIVNWPLFLLRCAVLLLVALGFGRLLLPLLGSGGERAYVVLVADVSGSMQASHAGKPVWEDAQARLGAVLDGLDGASKVALVPSPLGDYQPQWESVAEARARLTKLAPGAAANRLVGELREGLRLLGELPDDHPKVLHVVSDLQRSAFAGIDQLGVPANVELQLDKVGPVQANNRGVTVSVLAAGATDIGMYGFNDGTSGEVELFEGGKGQKYAIAPGQVVSRLAKDSAGKDEWVERRLVLGDDDSLAADNSAYDVFEPQAPVPVWMFEPRPARGQARAAGEAPVPGIPTLPRRGARAQESDDAVVRVFEQACYYLGAALQPAFVGESAAESRLQPRVLVAGELERALADLDKPGAPRMLVVPALGEVPDGLARLAGGLLERGGAVVWFGGPEVQPALYQSKFGEWLPALPGAAVAVPAGRSLATVDERHPLWGGLDVQTRRQLSGVKLRQRHALEQVKGARVLGYYADAQPLLVERKVANGRAYFFNTSADRAWSDWPADPPLFVPAVHLLVARALGQEVLAAAHEPLLAGERRTLTLDPALAGRELSAGEARFLIDAQGAASVRLATPGVVTLSVDGKPVTRVAVNFPPSESVLQSYPQSVALQRLESLRQQAGAPAVRWESGGEDGDLAWKLCLALGALLLLIEPVLANTRLKA